MHPSTTGARARVPVAIAVLALLAAALPAAAQQSATIRGRVTFQSTGDPVPGAVVVVVGSGRTARTNEQGQYEIGNVPAGTYEVLAQREHLTTTRQRVTVTAEQASEVNFSLAVAPLREQLTVTATPAGEATTFEAFNSIESFDTFEIARSAASTLAELVDRAPGVEVRSFGPGSQRPIIRGFDGDRVLILQDGVRTGDLSSQSGDHGTTIDPGSLERVEIIRGPATLLYGSNAIGGAVHAVTPQEGFRNAPFSGLRGQILSEGGTGNGQAAANANVQYGNGSWMFWAGGGSRRTGDYQTPEGPVENSHSRLSNGRVGATYSGNRAYFGVGYALENGRYGIPFAGDFHAHGEEDHHEAEDDHGHDHGAGEDHEDELLVDLQPRRHNVRLDFGVRNLQNRFAEALRVVVSHLDWRHDELEREGPSETLATRFENSTLSVRAELEQRRAGRFSGRVGVSSEFRSYSVLGEEALARDTDQRAVGVFAYEQIEFGPARLMGGARFDDVRYTTDARSGPDIPVTGGHRHGVDEYGYGILAPATRDRSLSGGSGSVGVHLGLRPGTAFVGTLTRAFRAPALEELYNFGLHVGNLTFEMGNTHLERERSIGLDVSLRHRATRARAEFNVFRYNVDNFVYLWPSRSERIRGLLLGQFLQGDSRFWGWDGEGSVGLHDRVWLHVGAGYVDSQLMARDSPLPRIPPLHGRVAADVLYGGLTVSPEISWNARQDRVFIRHETPTDGYTLVNLNASYTLARPQYAHIFTLSARNLTDELYRRHTSFIKELAPELGRSVRFSYGIRFF
ncbi:MAG: TonB-dependent receptor [Acidimicrobiia bacterium]|nr:TonB-dependent receptor [Acidimicrobiia bacterium]